PRARQNNNYEVRLGSTLVLYSDNRRRTMVKELLYDWFGLNEWLFTVLYALHSPYLDSVWKLASYGYSYWAVAFVAIALGYRYLRTRHTATEQQLERMGEFMVGLVIAFSLVWCCVYTFQNVTLMP